MGRAARVSDDYMYELRRNGNTLQKIAQLTDYPVPSVRRKVNSAAKKVLQFNPPATMMVLVDELKKAKVDDPPVYSAGFHLSGNFIVIGDIHVPTTSWDILDLMTKFADKHMPKKKRRLVIAGDLVNFDALSKYDHVVPPISLKAELKAAEVTLDYLFNTFDDVYYFMGNHEYRLMKFMQGAVDASLFAKVLYPHIEKGNLKLTMQTQAELISGGQRWRLTHQKNYSKLRGRVANDLAQKYHANIISWHEHHTAVQRDTYNRYTIINGGGAFDDSKMAYVGLVDGTNAAMSKGFTFIEDGVGHLLTPYPTLTSWKRWGLAAEAKQSIELEQERHDRMYGGKPPLVLVGA